ncbi:MAG: 30S ribosomal protein S12 methylthiotransferase RimO [bacterium]
MKVGIISLGCIKNLVDTEVMAGVLQRQGDELVQNVEDAEAIIINTCSFIEPAKRESIETILDSARFKHKGNCKWLIITGCLVQNYGKQLLDLLPESDIIVGTGEFYKIDTILNEIKDSSGHKRVYYIDEPLFLYDHTIPRKRLSLPHLAYVKISEGCDHKCSFCLIPRLRGHYRNRERESILCECRNLAAEGIKEICLIAQDTTAYPKLPSLVEQIAEQIYPVWLRILYTYPVGITAELLNVMSAHDNICNYIDIPIQHINDKILKAMNRSGSKTQIKNTISLIQRTLPGASLRTTLMVGFPGEGDAEFEELIHFVREGYFDHLGTFTYSREENTSAYYLEKQVPLSKKKERYDILMQIQAEISNRKTSQFVGTIQEVIIDCPHPEREGFLLGRTKTQAPDIDGCVLIKTGPSDFHYGDIAPMQIYDSDTYDLFAQPV